MEPLPIHALRAEFDRTDPVGRLVVSSPTGSGKSTEVPRWCAGRVLVVEPRRVACRTLAQRVSELEGTPLGRTVGYRVRDESRLSDETRILFCTPGVVLRAQAELSRFQTVILDEFHERSLELDLLLALMLRHFRGRLVVMSATLQDERVARHLGGTVLRAEGRTFPVTVRHLPGKTVLPDEDGLTARVNAALETARKDPGDILVFLPGKAEIAECARALERQPDVDILPLHGELTLEQQRRVFAPSSRRKVVLATNVAETSVTLPGIGVVIDSGLVRQTRYHRGRGHLALVPIALDSADQRAGRAGRTGPGVVYRLWSPAAKLAPITPPEIFRESLVPMLLGAAAWGEPLDSLPLLDRPRDDALHAARADLVDLGAIDARSAITACGRELFGLPLDPWLGRLLVEARARGCLPDAVDLAAALSVDRPLFLPGEPPEDLREAGCDATALIRAVRLGEPATHGLHPHVLDEARRMSDRLRRAQGLPERPRDDVEVARYRLAQAAMLADPRSAHVPRRRGGHTAWSHGGAEVELSRQSAVQRVREVDAVVVMDSRAVSQGHGENNVLVTCAMPVPLQWLVEAGLGTEKLAGVAVEAGRVVAQIERVYAKRTLATREDVPRGAVAREAVTTLFLRGSIFPGAVKVARERLEATALWSRLHQAGITLELYSNALPPDDVPALEEWTARRVEALGVESGDDLQLLSAGDLQPPDVPDEVRTQLDRHFPRTVQVGDVTFHAEYAPASRQVTLRPAPGARREIPPASFFPRFGGFRVVVEVGGAPRVVRERAG
ncbi:MAG: helicase-related protein [Myxococcota bacterium]